MSCARHPLWCALERCVLTQIPAYEHVGPFKNAHLEGRVRTDVKNSKGMFFRDLRALLNKRRLKLLYHFMLLVFLSIRYVYQDALASYFICDRTKNGTKATLPPALRLNPLAFITICLLNFYCIIWLRTMIVTGVYKTHVNCKILMQKEGSLS